MSYVRTGLLLIATVAVLMGRAAQAQTFIFNTTDNEVSSGTANQGNYNDFSGHTPASDNYVTGVLLSGDTVHSFFSFNLSSLNLSGKQVASATLTVTRFSDSSYLYTTHNPEVLDLYDVSASAASLKTTNTSNGADPTATANFNDLGSGSKYAIFSVPVSTQQQPTDPTQLLTIPLGGTAFQNIAAKAGSTVSSDHYFSVGGALENASAGDFIFGGSTSGSGSIQRLTVTLVPAPEPTTWLTMSLGGLGVYGLLLRIRRRSSLDSYVQQR